MSLPMTTTEQEPRQHLHTPAKDPKPEPTADPEPMPTESDQVCELALMSVQEHETEPMFVLETESILSTCMNNEPEPTTDPEPEPAQSDQVYELSLFISEGVLV